MRQILWILILSALWACDVIQGGSSQEKWTENVKLSNGEVLRVKREERHGSGEAGTSGGPLTYASLEFEYRGKQYKWESTNAAPFILEIDGKGRPVVAGDIGYDWAWRQRGSPCDRGVVEYSDGERWIQIPTWELPVSNRLNLADNKAKADRGLAAADDWESPTSTFNYMAYKKKCDKELELEVNRAR
jgi:hypothetical protein